MAKPYLVTARYLSGRVKKYGCDSEAEADALAAKLIDRSTDCQVEITKQQTRWKDKDKVITSFREGMTVGQIALKFNVPKDHAVSWIRTIYSEMDEDERQELRNHHYAFRAEYQSRKARGTAQPDR